MAPPQIINYATSTTIIHLLDATARNGTRIGKQSAAGLGTSMDASEEILGAWTYKVNKAVRLMQGLA